MLFQVVSLF